MLPLGDTILLMVSLKVTSTYMYDSSHHIIMYALCFCLVGQGGYSTLVGTVIQVGTPLHCICFLLEFGTVFSLRVWPLCPSGICRMCLVTCIDSHCVWSLLCLSVPRRMSLRCTTLMTRPPPMPRMPTSQTPSSSTGTCTLSK